ncbi:hypothetical protein NUU61_009523 [Penicillium alfredii]|uniref:Zn(2)-C6 fungal-type domain-containing protein n=1 Tax=Penicillium alfredii TaxID=1506179 RepID=A0A9W9JWZ1_9EURO|nr:uncharacterized protein NUU61_009523 [Penicillium alfredii]KAJ5084944.1 hypothetical protein NUU61_009523 [Penicillium alfredii]
MHPTLNYRHSRRSACDRCRGFKLRCERDHVNGMSCERCLKAQVMCTTSVNQPVPVFLPSSHASHPLPRGREGRGLDSERLSMSVLHKSSGPKVIKRTLPVVAPRRHESQPPDRWLEATALPYLGIENLPPTEETIPPMALDGGSSFALEPWADQSLPWIADPFQLPFPDYYLPGPAYRHEEYTSCSSTPGIDGPLDARNVNGMEISAFPQNEPPSYTGTEALSLTDSHGDPSWENISGWHPRDDPPNLLTLGGPCDTRQDPCKCLLKLNLDLMDDLHLMEADSMMLAPSSILPDQTNSCTGKMDLPIFRMLNHSSRFLEILQGTVGPPSEPMEPILVPEPNQKDSSMPDNVTLSTDVAESTLDEGATTTSSHDSGYQTALAASPDQVATSNLKCDIMTSLTILTTYCYLIRLHRAVFARLYQLFLIVPPADAAAFLLLPSLQFGQFHMEENYRVQVQVLIELSSSILGKVERALSVPYSSVREQEGEESSPGGSIFETGVFASLRDLVSSQEQIECEMSLRETIKCLRQLVKDPVSI